MADFALEFMKHLSIVQMHFSAEFCFNQMVMMKLRNFNIKLITSRDEENWPIFSEGLYLPWQSQGGYVNENMWLLPVFQAEGYMSAKICSFSKIAPEIEN